MKYPQANATYRPDIDGLRAVAVLAVIGFHAGIRLFSGGFVGVDIFFVISGFLITSIICRSLERGTFTFRDFYARRAKRIFPALVLVLLAVCAYGWFILLPDEFERLGKHLMAGSGFVSNLVLWKESGYFDKSAEAKPLLHLWSLGIEEQFYLLWPPLLVWAWKRKADVFKIAVAIVSVSFVINVMLISLWQASDMYYLPPTRFWELLAGSALGYAFLFRKNEMDVVLKRFASFVPASGRFTIENIQATSGLLLIFISVFALNQELLFPGWWALLPTIGTALLIAAGPEAWINRNLLSSRLLVFVGLISYPLYLWHWPLLSYAHIVQPGVLPNATVAAAVAIAFLLAWLTFRCVEMPLRFRSNPWALACASGLLIAGCLGLFVFAHHIHPRSQSYGLDKIVEAETGTWDFPGNLKPVQTSLGYHFEQGVGSSRVLFLGDSHVQQYYPRIDLLLTEHPNTTKSVAFVTQLGCPPVSYTLIHPKCKGMIENAFAVAEDPRIDTVVIGAAWYRYAAFNTNRPDDAYRDLAATITRFRSKGRRVYLLLSIPKGDVFAPSNIVKRDLGVSGFTIVQQIQRSDVDLSIKPIAEKLREIARSSGATAIDPIDYICERGDCPTIAQDGLPLYCDGSHLRSAYVRSEITFLDDIVVMDKSSGAIDPYM